MAVRWLQLVILDMLLHQVFETMLHINHLWGPHTHVWTSQVSTSHYCSKCRKQCCLLTTYLSGLSITLIQQVLKTMLFINHLWGPHTRVWTSQVPTSHYINNCSKLCNCLLATYEDYTRMCEPLKSQHHIFETSVRNNAVLTTCEDQTHISKQYHSIPRAIVIVFSNWYNAEGFHTYVWSKRTQLKMLECLGQKLNFLACWNSI